jgi:hypothetical protein
LKIDPEFARLAYEILIFGKDQNFSTDLNFYDDNSRFDAEDDFRIALNDALNCGRELKARYIVVCYIFFVKIVRRIHFWKIGDKKGWL